MVGEDFFDFWVELQMLDSVLRHVQTRVGLSVCM